MTSILIVEDMAIIREPIAAALRRRGFEVQAASSAATAMNAIELSRPEVVLLDIGLPDASGLDLARRIRDLGGAQPAIIMLTESGKRSDVLAAHDLRVDGYLLKSAFSIPRLEQMLARLGSGSSVQGGTRGVGEHSLAPEANIRRRITACADEVDPLKVIRAELGALSDLSLSPGDVVRRLVDLEPARLDGLMALSHCTDLWPGPPPQSFGDVVLKRGREWVRDVLIAQELVKADREFGARIGGADRSFWPHSLATGIIAAYLATSSGSIAPHRAFLAGIVRRIGWSILRMACPDEYGLAEEDSVTTRRPIDITFSFRWALHEHDLNYIVAKSWGVDTVRSLVRPERAAPGTVESLGEVGASTLAHVEAATALSRALRMDDPYFAISADSTRHVTSGQWAWMRSRAASLILSLGEQFACAYGSGVNSKQTCASRLGIGISVVGVRPDTDPFALLGHCASDTERVPDVHLAHARRTDTPATLLELVRVAEGEAHGALLPILVIADDGVACTLDDPSRTVQVIGAGAPVRAIEAAIVDLARLHSNRLAA